MISTSTGGPARASARPRRLTPHSMPSRSILEHRQEDDLHCDSHPFPGGLPWFFRPGPRGPGRPGHPAGAGRFGQHSGPLPGRPALPQLTAWRDALAAQGITLFLLSNSRKPGRAQNFAQAWVCPFQGRSGKPAAGGIFRPWSAWAAPRSDGDGGRPDLHRHSGGQQRRSYPFAGGTHPAGGQPGALSPATRRRPPSACWAKGGPSYECQIRARRQQRRFLRRPQVLPWPPPVDRGAGAGLLRISMRQGGPCGEDTARRVGENARKHGISLSLHAPYFINLANPDPDSLQKTIGYITSACLVASQMGGPPGL